MISVFSIYSKYNKDFYKKNVLNEIHSNESVIRKQVLCNIFLWITIPALILNNVFTGWRTTTKEYADFI